MSSTPRSSPAAVTGEFAGEFEAHTLRLLKQRFIVFCTLGAVFGLTVASIGLVLNVYRVFSEETMAGVFTSLFAALWDTAKTVGLGVFPVIAFLAAGLATRRGTVREASLLRLSQGVVVVVGAFHLGAAAFGVGGSIGWLECTAILFIACALLPWTVRQAFAVAASLVAIHLVLQLVARGWTQGLVFVALLMPMVYTPSILLAWMRSSRQLEKFRMAMLQQRYGEVRRELTDARRIHEALFPGMLLDGDVRMRYAYEPMRQIGGDYLYAHVGVSAARPESSRLSVVLMDVTGHGIPAALTVNRLHGELERVFAEDPAVPPGRVLELLNRYVHLTLANHSVYVTALCLRIDAGAGTLEYASGGHPPAFLAGVDGTIRELNSTAMVLGACSSADFDPAPAILDFAAGDTILAYTDGAIEARDKSGRMLGIQGLLRQIATMAPHRQRGDQSWSKDLLLCVERFRFGPPADDTLIVEISCPFPPSSSGSAPSRLPAETALR